MKIIAGPASQLLASRVARQMGEEPVLCEYKTFPDGELYTRILEEETGDVTIIQSTPTDTDLIALLQLIDACEAASAINVVIPYMGYSRQDKMFKKGEALSARAIARTIGADNVFTINIHEQSILGHFRASAADLDASPLFGDYLKNLGLKDPLLIAPDAGALELAKNASKNAGILCESFEKTRHDGDSVTIREKEIDVFGKEVIILDDMIATGGTMAESIKMLKKQGAADVYVACVHPVLSRNAVVRLHNAGVRGIIATDTLEKAHSRITVAPLIADAIKRL